MKTKIKDYDLITDSREQEKLPFRKTIIEKLDFGDYAARVNGELLPVVFERKNPIDAHSTLTKGHERFKEELLRACDKGYKLIVTI
jgi:hypothetical protein